MKYGQKRLLTLREKVLCTLFILLLFRLLAHVPLPFVNPEYISSLLDTNGSLTFFNALTGGGFESMSLMALGITPYISASIIIQLLGVVIPRLADMQKEGATGRKMIERISICLAVVLALVQSLCMTWGYGKSGLLTSYKWYTVLVPALLMTVGVFLLAFAGQMITKHFFGNGTSLILLAGILSSYFGDANMLYEVITSGKKLPVAVVLCVVALIAIVLLFWFTFYLNQCEKRISVTYSQKMAVNGGSHVQTSVIPLKLIPGSVVPIIFASSIITLPALVQSFTGTDVKWLWLFNSAKWFQKTAWWASFGALLYCLMIIGFSYYYNSLNLNEIEMANNLKKHGGFVHGIRPGKPTSDYIKKQMRYMTFIGALGLCVIAIVPNVITNVLGISRLSFLGTSIIITVSVICETKKKFLTDYQTRNLYMSRMSGSSKTQVRSRSVFGNGFQREGRK